MARDSSTVQACLLTLPDEVLYQIAAFLDVPDVLSLRQTCIALHDLTRAKSIWIDLIRQQQQYLPFRPGVRTQDSLADLTSVDLESIVVEAYNVERKWLLPRAGVVKKIAPHFGSFILALELFLDRWLLCVYSEGVIALWDLQKRFDLEPEHSGSCIACIRLPGNKPWTSSVSCLDFNNDGIIVATARTEGPTTTRIVRIPFTPGRGYPDYDYESLATILSSSAQIIRTIDPATQSIAFSRSCFIDVVNWDTQESVSLSTQSEDLDELWNGIVGVRICEGYILCIKTRSVELYPLPPLPISSSPKTSSPRIRPIASHPFPATNFRGVSISHPQPSRSPSSWTISFLAYDVLRGLFHHQITLDLPESGAPHLSVALCGVHLMSSLIRSPSISALAAEISGRHTGRGFVSACYLGPEGRRGVWIERTRASTKRSVMVFSATTPLGARVTEGDFVRQAGGDGPVIDGRPVHEIGSYDLRDDLTHCAFSEVTGRIILGTRAGHIQVL